MSLTDEQIKSILTKDSSAKTVLVNLSDVNNVINNHLKDGWKLVKKIKMNDKCKIVFCKIK